jgi:hypothetical protein
MDRFGAKLLLPFWLMLLSVLAAPLDAQSVRGRTIDALTGQEIPGVRIVLLRANGTRVTEVISNANGLFQIATRDPGEYKLEASHIAYRSFTTESVLLRGDEQLVVDLKMSVTAIELDPLEIVARRLDPRHEATEDGMYARRLLSRPIGSSRVILPHDPEMVNALDVRDVLSWAAPRQRGCTVVWWNGRLVTDSAAVQLWLETPVTQLEAVEFYRTPIDAPAVFRELPIYAAFDNAYCSIIALWPRSGRYLAEGAPLPVEPAPWRGYLTASVYHIAGRYAPGLGFGLEASAHWPLVSNLAIGVHMRGSMHQLDAATTDDMTATASDITYVLPAGDRGFQLFVLGIGPRLTLREHERVRIVLGGRIQIAQRQFSLLSTNVGNRGIGLMSRGWGAGLTAGIESRITERLSADLSLGQDWLNFGGYEALDREPTSTGANWRATAIRLGITYDIVR